ncbi:ABC transporter ATP-binding protein [Anaerocolumna sp. AGMB13020]|uniref:ABC transporter ATP-binding protein n=1 Tax=Anaerocolumna sp. AGMB13020 TaxID=3081750 RepID=UPI0029547505|nr:ABC transporter ATP-binding protein [Anaerocolumna sp. AGMB13020]WOO37555.1 ABC transporter ATP-binding protein [Anaerocolumna sp. AGMB13020]
MGNNALELNNITKSYHDGEEENIVLNNVSLSVEYGEFAAIVGPSGSGKSTLLSIAGALLSPTSGEVRIGKTLLSDRNKKHWDKVRREQIGFVFQSHQLLPYLKVMDQLKLITWLSSRKDKKEQEEHAAKLLEDFGLNNRAAYYPDKLSGGEKQRVAIARALMNHPDVLLADEPTASLDKDRGRQVVEMIRKETKKYKKAALMVTHDERILDLVDSVYRIENGIITKEK